MRVEGRVGVAGEPDGELLRGLIAAVLDGHDEEDVLDPRLLFVAEPVLELVHQPGRRLPDLRLVYRHKPSFWLIHVP